jgi:regulator of cell morphogenesis and NO signaling
MFKLNDTVGNIVTEFPGAAEILKENKIDFCCGGDRELKLAVKEDLNDDSKAADSAPAFRSDKKDSPLI